MRQKCESVIVETGIGRIEGRRHGELSRFRGVPYAQAPVAQHRFCPPRPAVPWTGVLKAVDPAPVAPQLASRLVGVMGEFTRVQSEDCLSLDIVTPDADGKRRPVVVWLHGGGFSSGSGGLDWYDGSLLASEGDVVVVGVNYRLGVLGFLYEPGICNGNLGLLDQALALRFVREQIACFGGDPDNITLMGQSAGANSILALFAAGRQGEGIRRVILQSAALGMPPQNPDAARSIGEEFLRELGVGGTPDAAPASAADTSVGAILEAQAAIARRHARLGDTAPPFQLVHQVAGLPEERIFDRAAATAMDGVDVLIGFTTREAEAFFALDPRIRGLDGQTADHLIAELYGARGIAHRDTLLRSNAEMSPAGLLSAVVSWSVFVEPAVTFAERRSQRGGRVHVYAFAWHPDESPFDACHCLELPFVFGPTAAWRNAPMLAAADPDEVARLSASMRAAWLSFVRTGNPSAGENTADWPAFGVQHRRAMRFGRSSQIIELRDAAC